MREHLTAIEAAIKAKAPIVAIPIEGYAPICLKRKILAGWAKGVRITHTEIGENRRLIVRGYTAKGYVRCSASFVAIERREAQRELAKWTDKERAKIQKQRALGALSKEFRKSLRLAKFDDDGALTPVTVRTKEDKILTAYGVPVTIPELSEYAFILHRSVTGSNEMVEDWWSVTETSSGHSAGNGATAEAALLHARNGAAKASPEKLAKVRETISAQALSL